MFPPPSFFHCDVLFLQGKHNGFCHIVASVEVNFMNSSKFDAFTCVIMILSSNSNSLNNCNNMTKPVVFTLQQ